jgi:glyoxylase-like metal-dependent hydrolase (beta-lactamase superfamily II)
MVTLSPRVARLRASNPSPLTLDGTNGYVVRVGPRSLVAIDPGPVDDRQRNAFLAAARDAGATYAAILVTHGHPDHFPGAAPLAAATGAPVYAHPLARFPHDRTLADGERLEFADAAFVVLHGPGHAPDHLVFVLDDERALFTGDIVLGTGTVVVAPPSGEMRTYQRTLHRLRDEYGDAHAIYGGHGPEVRDVRAKLDEYIAHREAREQAIVAVLAVDGADASTSGGPGATIPEIVERVYAAVDARLWPAAARQVLAHLLALESEGRVRAEPLEREPTRAEAALLNPDLSRLDENLGADVIRAELGYGTKEPLLRYVLI